MNRVGWRWAVALTLTALAMAFACGGQSRGPLASVGDGGGGAGVDAASGGPCDLQWAAVGLQCYSAGLDAGPACSVPCSGLTGSPGTDCSMPCLISGCCGADYAIPNFVTNDAGYSELSCAHYGGTSAQCSGSDVFCSNCGGYCCPYAFPLCSADCFCNANNTTFLPDGTRNTLGCTSGSSSGGGGCSRCRQ